MAADKNSGVVDDITYQDIQSLLYIKPAPGRKESGLPSKQTIRNHIKAIERECPEDFRVITEGQSLKFLFPKLPVIYAEAFADTEGDTEVNTEPNTPEPRTNTGKHSDFQMEDNTEVNTHPDTERNTGANPSRTHEMNNNKNINNNNTEKASVPADFYPSAQTIERALTLGYTHVTDHDEIQAFIDHNLATGSRFVDFNPVYLRWLAKSVAFAQQTPKTFSRSTHHAGSNRHETRQPSAVERVKQAYAREHHYCPQTRSFHVPGAGSHPESGLHGHIVDAAC